MVKIRLNRVGTKNQPKYRVVVIDSQKARNGGFVEIIGTVDLTTKQRKIELKKDRYDYWRGVGAQTSAAVETLVN